MKNLNIKIPLVGFLNVIVFLAFFFAKIYNLIDWNWWWVFSPLWIVPAGVVIFGLILIVLYLILFLIEDLWMRK